MNAQKKHRNLGNNYALAWPVVQENGYSNTSPADDSRHGQYHMTLVYLNNVKRGFEQDRLKDLVNAFFDAQNVPETLTIEITDMLTDRCVSVESDYVDNLRKVLEGFLISKGFSLRELMPLHIDLRGDDLSKLVNPSTKEITIETRKWNW